MQATLTKVARLYDLVEEMRGIISELHEVDVEVKIGTRYDQSDPLAAHASIMVLMRPGCERLDPGYSKGLKS